VQRELEQVRTRGRTPEEVYSELEQLRALQRTMSPRLEPSVGSLVLRGAVRTLILWGILVLAFLGIWVFLGPVR
jgi:hypothetical protein